MFLDEEELHLQNSRILYDFMKVVTVEREKRLSLCCPPSATDGRGENLDVCLVIGNESGGMGKARFPFVKLFI